MTCLLFVIASNRRKQLEERVEADKAALDRREAQLVEREAAASAAEEKLRAEKRALSARDKALAAERAAVDDALVDVEHKTEEISRQRQSR